MQKTENLHIRIDSDLKNWLSILDKKYNVNISQFIRLAIVEKMKRDTPKLRLKLESEKIKCPF